MAKKKKSKKFDEEKFEKRFAKYYDKVKVDLDAFKNEHNPKDKELLALRIHYKRTRFLRREPDRSKKLC